MYAYTKRCKCRWNKAAFKLVPKHVYSFRDYVEKSHFKQSLVNKWNDYTWGSTLRGDLVNRHGERCGHVADVGEDDETAEDAGECVARRNDDSVAAKWQTQLFYRIVRVFINFDLASKRHEHT